MSSYFLARLAWTCLYQRKAWSSAAFAYGGKPMMHWCKREVKFAADWVMKAHVQNGKIAPYPRSRKWGANDQFVAMARAPHTAAA